LAYSHYKQLSTKLTNILLVLAMMTLTLNLRDADLAIDEVEFYRLCQVNPESRLELTAEGHLVVAPRTGWETGHQNMSLSEQVGRWVRSDGSGLGFGSSTGFVLPDGSIRSPDVAWVKRDRITAISPDPSQFLPLCPDFVIELRSANDYLRTLQAKMQTYLDNGLLLGWLINPADKTVEIYRQAQAVTVVPLAGILSGEPELPGLQINLDEIF
jgi:Uma2 family endonuclease